MRTYAIGTEHKTFYSSVTYSVVVIPCLRVASQSFIRVMMSHSSITKPSSHHSFLPSSSLVVASRYAPVDGFGAKTPPSLSSIQCFGALSRLRCFFNPRVMIDFFEAR